MQERLKRAIHGYLRLTVPSLRESAEVTTELIARAAQLWHPRAVEILLAEVLAIATDSAYSTPPAEYSLPPEFNPQSPKSRHQTPTYAKPNPQPRYSPVKAEDYPTLDPQKAIKEAMKAFNLKPKIDLNHNPAPVAAACTIPGCCSPIPNAGPPPTTKNTTPPLPKPQHPTTKPSAPRCVTCGIPLPGFVGSHNLPYDSDVD